MSLLDALLLEGYRDPHEVWIALRSDGIAGSGTIDDPYDGGTRLGPSISAHLSCNRIEFVAGTGFPHQLEVGNQVTISGAHGANADWFNGVFTVQAKTSLHFTLQFTKSGLPAAPPAVQYYYNGAITVQRPDGSIIGVRIYWPVAKVTTDTVPHGLTEFGAVDVTTNDSFAGTYVALSNDGNMSFRYRMSFLPGADVSGNACTIARRIHRFDDVMRSLPNYSVVHLGPGTFETRGYASIYSSSQADFSQVYVGYALRTGQRLIGSGLDVSVLKLVLPIDELSQTAAISNPTTPPADYVGIDGLTVDCNGPAHVPPFGIFPAPVTCGAVGLCGTFNSVRRVRVVNSCVQAGPECFALSLSFAGGIAPIPASFNVIEDCIVEKPSENNTHETTMLSSQGPAYTDSRSLICRHNYHSAAFANGWITQLVPVSLLTTVSGSGSPPLAELTTSSPHFHIKGKSVVVQGVKVGGNLSTVYNGIYFIEQIISDSVLRYRLEASPEVGTIDVTGASIGWAISSEPVAIDSITYNTGETPVTVNILTKVPHRRTRGQSVLLNAISGSQTDFQPSAFNDTFAIIRITSSSQFVIPLPMGAPADPSTLGLNVNNIQASVGPDFFGRGGIGGTGCVTEGNAYHDCLKGCYQDTGSTRDLVLRDNYHSNVGLGVDINFDPNAFSPFVGTSAIVPVQVGGENRGLFTTIQPHGKSVGNLVTIREAGAANPDAGNPYHGSNLQIKDVPNNYQFAYRFATQGDLPVNNCAGRPVYAASIAVSTMSYVSASRLLTIVTASAHGLAAGDFVDVWNIQYFDGSGYFSGFVGPVIPDPLDTAKFTIILLPTDPKPTKSPGSGGSLDRHVAAGVVRNGNAATITTAAPHGFLPGQTFKVQGAWVSSTQANGYNGTVTVKSASTRAFSYDMKPVGGVVPGGTDSATGPVEFAPHADIRWFDIENNVYDLYATDANTAVNTRGLSAFGLGPPDIPPYIFPMLAWRDNVVRHREQQMSATRVSYGLYVTTIGSGSLVNNIVDVSATYALSFQYSTNVTALQNSAVAGTIVRGYDVTDPSHITAFDDIEIHISDVMVMSFL